VSKLKVTVASAAVALCALALPSMAGATTIPVNSIFDNKTDDQLCTLREAVDAANTNLPVNPGGGADCPSGESGNTDTITLAATPTFPYILSGPANDDANVSGDLDITAGGELVIDGTTDGNEVPTTIVDGAHLDRIFDLRPSAEQVKFFAQKLILVHGAVAGSAAGGAIRVADPDADFGISTSRVHENDAGGSGGGISFDNAAPGYVFGVSQTEFSGNNADEEGGAIYVDTLQDANSNVETSTFVGNTAGTMGGAVYIESVGSSDTTAPVLTLVNSTVTGNVAGTGGGALAFDFAGTGTAQLKFTTIDGNSTPTAAAGGAIYTNDASQLALFLGSIVSKNTAAGSPSNCAGPGQFISLGYNLDSGSSCFNPAQSTDLVNNNPLLAPLDAYTGGKLTTRTQGLYDGSPALDRIPRTPTDQCDINNDANHTNDVDQRYVTRDVPPALCDIGAFEGSLGAAPDSDGDGLIDPLDDCPTQSGPASSGGCPLGAVTPLAQPAPLAFNLAAAKRKCKKKFPGKANAQRRKKCIKKAKRRAGLA
jgi:CSLREA domain-containing protein